jgi:thioredoxin reductase (NADPH)
MSIAETRRPQIFPQLKPAEIERLYRFGEVKDFADGDALFRIGEPGHGLFVILAGKVALFRNDHRGGRTQFHTHEAGAILGELSQLSGRPALVDGYAVGPVEGLHLPPDRLRALLVAEAELGERISAA